MYKEVDPSLAGLISLEADEPSVSFGISMGKIVAAGDTIDFNSGALDQAMKDSGISEKDRGRIDIIFAAPDDDKLLPLGSGGSTMVSDDGKLTVVCRYRGTKQQDEELLGRSLYHELLHVKKRLDNHPSPAASLSYRIGVASAATGLGETSICTAMMSGIFSAVSQLALQRMRFLNDTQLSILEMVNTAEWVTTGVAGSVGAIALASSIGGYWLNQEEREARQAGKKYPGTPLVTMGGRGGHNTY